MGLPKGRTNNPAGRVKGSANKVTKELRERISDFLGHNWETVEKDFKALDPATRIAMYERLLKFVLPAMQSVSMDATVNTRLGALTDDQLNNLIEKVINETKSL